MTEDEKPEFLNLLVGLADTFDAKITDGRIDGYWQALQDLELGALRNAVGKALNVCDRFPPPVKLRELDDPLTADHEQPVLVADLEALVGKPLAAERF